MEQLLFVHCGARRRVLVTRAQRKFLDHEGDEEAQQRDGGGGEEDHLEGIHEGLQHGLLDSRGQGPDHLGVGLELAQRTARHCLRELRIGGRRLREVVSELMRQQRTSYLQY